MSLKGTKNYAKNLCIFMCSILFEAALENCDLLETTSWNIASLPEWNMLVLLLLCCLLMCQGPTVEGKSWGRSVS